MAHLVDYWLPLPAGVRHIGRSKMDGPAGQPIHTFTFVFDCVRHLNRADVLDYVRMEGKWKPFGRLVDSTLGRGLTGGLRRFRDPYAMVFLDYARDGFATPYRVTRCQMPVPRAEEFLNIGGYLVAPFEHGNMARVPPAGIQRNIEIMRVPAITSGGDDYDPNALMRRRAMDFQVLVVYQFFDDHNYRDVNLTQGELNVMKHLFADDTGRSLRVILTYLKAQDKHRANPGANPLPVRPPGDSVGLPEVLRLPNGTEVRVHRGPRLDARRRGNRNALLQAELTTLRRRVEQQLPPGGPMRGEFLRLLNTVPARIRRNRRVSRRETVQKLKKFIYKVGSMVRRFVEDERRNRADFFNEGIEAIQAFRSSFRVNA